MGSIVEGEKELLIGMVERVIEELGKSKLVFLIRRVVVTENRSVVELTYPDFPKPDNEAERINRIAELSLEQFPKSEILQNVCEIAGLPRSDMCDCGW